ncbi:MAG: hypothetical protein WBP08_15600 [Saprospiraceae bacterium]
MDNSVLKVISSVTYNFEDVKMDIFSRIFKTYGQTQEPEIQFGRYTDSYKPDEKYDCWNRSNDFFENEKYLNSYTNFLDFLTVDKQKNVTYSVNQGVVTFTLYQGSKIINGSADHVRFCAEAKIAVMNKRHLGMMRLLLEENFDLKYSRYSVDRQDCICIKFDTYVEDGSPHKLYQALKELATVADKRDDVLMQTFEDLQPVNYHHTRPISLTEKKIKFAFFHSLVSEALEEIDKGRLNTFLYPGGLSFLLLDLLYKIDFLIKPEGNIMETIQASHNLFFNDNMTGVHEKNKEIIRNVRQFEKINFDDFERELYEVNSTFGISVPDGHQRLVEIIDAQISDFEWYYENKYYNYSKAICGYVVGFSLYSYSIPEPSRDLLILYYRILNHDFFKSLGFSDSFNVNGSFNKKKVISYIRQIIENHKEKYNGLQIAIKTLDFTDEYLFCRSYLIMLRNIVYP